MRQRQSSTNRRRNPVLPIECRLSKLSRMQGMFFLMLKSVNEKNQADQGVCCPKMQTICTQPLRVGNCDRSVRRYWYSAATRECQSFEYTGDYNFLQPPRIICIFVGCQGNDNNFETLVDCQTFCRNAAPEPRCLQGQAYKDNQGKFVTCSPNRQASSCPANFECFFDGSLHACCPTKAFTCSLSPNSGKTCGPGISFKYYYNSQTQECESFEYLGCDGNSNNFASRTECETFCGVGGRTFSCLSSVNYLTCVVFQVALMAEFLSGTVPERCRLARRRRADVLVPTSAPQSV